MSVIRHIPFHIGVICLERRSQARVRKSEPPIKTRKFDFYTPLIDASATSSFFCLLAGAFTK